MSFDVAADAYGRFMGRFSEPLAPMLVDLVDLRPGQRAVDVGCGPGALTAVLVERLGAQAVAAIDPSESFVAAARTRLPGVDLRTGGAEALPFADDAFDAAFAQLVVHFMRDPVAGLSEMARVTRPGGLVAASVWDHGSDRGPLSLFWAAVRTFDPDEEGEAARPGSREGQLADLFADAGLLDVTSTVLAVRLGFTSFAEWWDPFTLGVGPAGEHVAGLDDGARARLADRCAALLGPAPFTIEAAAWTAIGRVADAP